MKYLLLKQDCNQGCNGEHQDKISADEVCDYPRDNEYLEKSWLYCGNDTSWNVQPTDLKAFWISNQKVTILSILFLFLQEYHLLCYLIFLTLTAGSLISI